MANWTRVRDHRVYQLSQSVDAALFLSSPLSADDIAEFGADTITMATGSRWRSDGVGSTNFEPLDLGNIRVLSPDDIMDGAAAKLPKTEFVVYDDDHFYTAGTVAESLIASGHSVIFACPLPSIAAWTEYTLDQCRIVERLVGLGADIRPNLKLEAGCKFRNTLTGEYVELNFSGMAFVGARAPGNDLCDTLKSVQGIGEISKAGDCVAPGIIQAAVLSGHSTARRILKCGEPSGIIRRDRVEIDFPA